MPYYSASCFKIGPQFFSRQKVLLPLSTVAALKPSSGPPKSRECLPLILIIRNMLKYALTYREVISILMQHHVLVDGKFKLCKVRFVQFGQKGIPYLNT
ncbi:40S ribosomal protein S4-3 [Zea mays]|uniref:40S ribosomal protein S4-3 n=1 Tax=Zea mays TaxID=4577 RepID=A0A1D6PZB6_MAIZE|nr:40S ribosomal protein S4-3 [Zea mays]